MCGPFGHELPKAGFNIRGNNVLTTRIMEVTMRRRQYYSPLRPASGNAGVDKLCLNPYCNLNIYIRFPMLPSEFFCSKNIYIK